MSLSALTSIGCVQPSSEMSLSFAIILISCRFFSFSSHDLSHVIFPFYFRSYFFLCTSVWICLDFLYSRILTTYPNSLNPFLSIIFVTGCKSFLIWAFLFSLSLSSFSYTFPLCCCYPTYMFNIVQISELQRRVGK